jgi:hypothetical protein
MLSPNGSGVLNWNSTRYDKENPGSPQFIVWPAMIELEDGSKWVGSFTKCTYRSVLNAINPAIQCKVILPPSAKLSCHPVHRNAAA